MTKAQRKELIQVTKLKTLRNVLKQVEKVMNDKLDIEDLQDELICEIVELENLIEQNLQVN